MFHSPESDNAHITPLAYHELSKHRPNAYVPGPATLDWDTQPNPFRAFAGASKIELPLTVEWITIPDSALLAGRIPPANLSGPSIGALLELGRGISAWKSNGVDRWAVRCNPSSGNLHPVEAYLVLPAAATARRGGPPASLSPPWTRRQSKSCGSAAAPVPSIPARPSLPNASTAF